MSMSQNRRQRFFELEMNVYVLVPIRTIYSVNRKHTANLTVSTEFLVLQTKDRGEVKKAEPVEITQHSYKTRAGRYYDIITIS